MLTFLFRSTCGSGRMSAIKSGKRAKSGKYSDNASHLILTYCLMNCCIKSISHLQTPLIIKSCQSSLFIAILFHYNQHSSLHCTMTARLWRESAAQHFWGAHHRESHLDHQHHVTLQEGTTVPTLSPPAEKSKSPFTHLHHFLQGNH